jgi:F-type H+-transporting ATPase subunit epsilon
MAATFQLKVVTPQGAAYEGTAVHVRIPNEDGFVGILANHAPYVTSSPGGPLEIREPGGSQKTYTTGVGFFEIAHNQAIFLTQSFSAVS